MGTQTRVEEHRHIIKIVCKHIYFRARAYACTRAPIIQEQAGTTTGCPFFFLQRINRRRTRTEAESDDRTLLRQKSGMRKCLYSLASTNIGYIINPFVVRLCALECMAPLM